MCHIFERWTSYFHVFYQTKFYVIVNVYAMFMEKNLVHVNVNQMVCVSIKLLIKNVK